MAVSAFRPAFRRVSEKIDQATRYDFVLAVIPAAFLGAAGFQQLLAVSTPTAALFAALVSGLAVVDALFLNPPAEPSSSGPPG